MKKMLLTASVVWLVLPHSICLEAQTDSMASSREDLYYQYLDIRNNTLQYKEADYIMLTNVLEQIVLQDNRLLDTAQARAEKFDGFQKELDNKDAEIKRIDSERSHSKELLFYTMIAAGASFLLFLLFLILFISRISSLKKYRRKLASMFALETEVGELRDHTVVLESRLNGINELYENTLKEKEQAENKARDAGLQIVALKTEISGLQTEAARREKEQQKSMELLQAEISELKKKSEENEAQLASDRKLILSLQKEYEKTQEIHAAEAGELKEDIRKSNDTVAERERDLLEAHTEIAQLRKALTEKETQIKEQPPDLVRDEKFIAKAGDIELLTLKLEKLESLRQKGILTEQDYLPLKEKFLGEL